MKVSILFLVDFDGTVTEVDTVEAMVKRFAKGDWKALNQLWEERKIDTEEVAQRIFAMFDADQQDILAFTETMKIDSHFAEFAAEVKKSGDRLHIVSDGYDFLIEAILHREGLQYIPYHANKMFIHGSKFSMEPGGMCSSCGLCGTCKRKVMEKLRRPGDTVVFVGDSYSDQCVVEYADKVFAKHILLSYCREKNISCQPYTSFRDILAWYRSKRPQQEDMLD
jgi:2-hydroxy-3-keto-5-methylthiopentenyl-1-phosphate phosphatase